MVFESFWFQLACAVYLPEFIGASLSKPHTSELNGEFFIIIKAITTVEKVSDEGGADAN